MKDTVADCQKIKRMQQAKKGGFFELPESAMDRFTKEEWPEIYARAEKKTCPVTLKEMIQIPIYECPTVNELIAEDRA